MKKSAFLLLAIFLTQCVSSQASLKTIKDGVIAQKALQRAKKVGSQKFSLENYVQAQKFYTGGMEFYRQGDYSQARGYFQKSILLSEKAEIKSLHSQQKEWD